MIKVDHGSISVSGSKLLLMAELTTLIAAFKQHGFNADDIDTCVKTADMSSEELKKSIDDMKETIKNKTIKNIEDVEDLIRALFEE